MVALLVSHGAGIQPPVWPHSPCFKISHSIAKPSSRKITDPTIIPLQDQAIPIILLLTKLQTYNPKHQNLTIRSDLTPTTSKKDMAPQSSTRLWIGTLGTFTLTGSSEFQST